MTKGKPKRIAGAPAAKQPALPDGFIDRGLAPVQHGAGIFYVEADSLIASLERHVLSGAEDGFATLVGEPGSENRGLLASLESEAIARLQHAGMATAMMHPEHMRSVNWDRWRAEWAEQAATRIGGYTDPDDRVAYTAARLLCHCADLRRAVSARRPELAAAHAMLVVCWAIDGGVSIRLEHAEPIAHRHVSAQRARAKAERTTVGADDGRTTKARLVGDALLAAGPEAGTPEVWGHLPGVLERCGFVVTERGAKENRRLTATAGEEVQVFTWAGVRKMLGTLRAEAGRGAKRGRPRKNSP